MDRTTNIFGQAFLDPKFCHCNSLHIGCTSINIPSLKVAFTIEVVATIVFIISNFDRPVNTVVFVLGSINITLDKLGSIIDCMITFVLIFSTFSFYIKV